MHACMLNEKKRTSFSKLGRDNNGTIHDRRAERIKHADAALKKKTHHATADVVDGATSL